MAGSRTYRTKAIVLDKTKLKETDLILTLVDQTGRRVRVVAKGARKPGSRLAARCELCCEVDLLLAHGRSLDIVSQAELVAAPLGSQPSYELLMSASAVAEVARHCTYEDAEDPLRSLDIVSQAELVAAPLGSQPSYELLMSASAVAEVARHCTYEDAEDPFVFAITRAVLAQLFSLDAPHLDLIVAAYVFKLLSHIGYLPDCSSCVACEDEAPTYFSAHAGGLLCASRTLGTCPIAPPAWRARTRRQRISPRMRAVCSVRAAPRACPAARRSSLANPLGWRASSP